MLGIFKNKLIGKGEVYLRIKARPGASKSVVKEIMVEDENEIIKINIAAEPVSGRANKELIRFLAEEFKVSKNNIRIISGAGEKIKLVKIIK